MRVWRDGLERERDRWPLFLPVLACAGAAAYFGWPSEPPRWPAPALALAGLLCLLPRGRNGAAGRALGAALLALGAGFGAGALATARAPALVPLPRHAVVVSGRIRAIDLLPDGGRRLTVADPRLDGGPALGRVIRVRLRATDTATLADGDAVAVRALLRAPSPPPYPGGWDTRRDAFFDGLAGSGFAIGPARVTGLARGGSVATWWRGVRDRIAARVLATLPDARGAIAATLLVGLGSAIPADDRQAFADSGLAHLLAVAGLHIGIVMGLALGLARFLLSRSERVSLHWPTRGLAAVAALLAGLFYLLLTGAHVPIVRSFAMATLATAALLAGRRPISMRGLAVAATAIVLVSPDAITGVSFQMSFAAVATLIAGYEVARPLFARLARDGAGRRLALHVAALALTSLLAGAASMPYAAYHFGRIQLFFVAANLVAVPLTALWIMPCGLAALALMPFGLAAPALVPMGWGIGLVLRLAHLVAACPGAVIPVRALPLSFLLLASAGIAVLCLLRTRLRLFGLVPLAGACAAAAIARPPDLVVSEGGRIVALPGPGGTLVVERARGGSSYAIGEDARVWAASGDPLRLPPDGSAGGVSCTHAACVARIRDRTLLIVRAAGAGEAGCGEASLVVSIRPLSAACRARPHITGSAVWRAGAIAAWIGPGDRVRFLTDRTVSGDRPWTPPDAGPPARHHAAPSLPVAAVDG